MKELYTGCLVEEIKTTSSFPRTIPEIQSCFAYPHSLHFCSLLTSPDSTHPDMGGIPSPRRLRFPVRLFLAVCRFFITGSLRELRKINTHYVILSVRQEAMGGRPGKGGEQQTYGN